MPQAVRSLDGSRSLLVATDARRSQIPQWLRLVQCSQWEELYPSFISLPSLSRRGAGQGSGLQESQIEGRIEVIAPALRGPQHGLPARAAQQGQRRGRALPDVRRHRR